MKVYLNGVNVIVERGAPFTDIAIPSTDARVIEWNGSDDLGIHDEINQETYKENYSNIFDESGASYGATKQEVKDALEEFVGEVPPNGGTPPPPNETVVNLTPSQELATTVDEVEFNHSVTEVPQAPAMIPTTGVIDPTGVAGSPWVDNLADGDYGNLCYNDDSTLTANKEMPAIDLGSSLAVSQISIWWWNTAYNSSNFKIQGSNNGTSWTDVVTGQSSVGVIGRQDIAVSGTFRYWRVFCVVGVNPVYIVLSEMEAFDVPAGVDRYINNADGIISIYANDSGKIVIKNNTTQNIVVKIKH